jgi:NADPH2:quinone reductase
MRCVEISRPGPPSVLKLARREIPQPKDGEVLIEVAAAGVNRPDCLQRAGAYPSPPGASDLPGLEVAGSIVRVGAGAGARLGDEVCALVPGGGYAEYCVVRADHCLPIPGGWSMTEAAGLPETVFTVWINVFERAALRPAESLLVQGGSGGIGVTAIQMARAFGSRVFATAGSPEKCAYCEELGAERCINYKTEDFVEAVRAATKGKGVDVILDIVGGDYVAREVACLATDGRLSIIGFQGGTSAVFNTMDVLSRRLTITGSTLRPRTADFKARVANALRENVWPLLESRRVRPVIFKALPLEQAEQAHGMMESQVHFGKIVLKVANQ